jgi:hypothetical protein
VRRPRTPAALALGAAVLALAAPAAAHRSLETRAPEPGMFGQRPIALPAQQPAEPPIVASPRADCLPGGIPEGPMQGRVSAEDIAAGKVDKGYLCNVKVIGTSGSAGGFRVHRYIDRNGHECAYYDTTLLFPTNALSLSAEPTGVAVLDMTDPANPKRCRPPTSR